MPRSIAVAQMAGTKSRLSGTPSWLGSSQAKDLTATTTSRGKDPGSTTPGPLLETSQLVFEEAFSPLGHDHPAGVQSRRDLLVVEARGSHEHDLGADDVSIR
jgi:hypothetical protein